MNNHQQKATLARIRDRVINQEADETAVDPYAHVHKPIEYDDNAYPITAYHIDPNFDDEAMWALEIAQDE